MVMLISHAVNFKMKNFEFGKRGIFYIDEKNKLQKQNSQNFYLT